MYKNDSCLRVLTRLCAGPKYRLSSDEEDIAPQQCPPRGEPEKPATINEHDRQLTAVLDLINLQVEEDDNVIMSYVDSLNLELADPQGRPFIGLDMLGRMKTFNNPQNHWYLQRTFLEFCAQINACYDPPGGFNIKCSSHVKDAIIRFITEGHEGVFYNWLQGHSGGPDEQLRRHDFVWNNFSDYKRVRSIMKKLKKSIPVNPCQARFNRIKNERQRRKAKAAKGRAKAAEAAAR